MTEINTEPPRLTIEPGERWPLLHFRELWATRRILWVLSKRILKARYQDTALGILWVLLQPLILVAIISTFLGLIVDRGERDGLPFAVFLFCAWVPYRIFQKMEGEGGSSVAANGALVQRIYVPRLHFPLSVALSSIPDYIFLMLALLGLEMLYGITPGIGLLALPLLTAILYAVSLGLALLVSSSQLRYRDMEIVVPLLTQAWFWASPVIYPSTIVPEQYRMLYYLNPLVVVIDGFRWAFAQSPAPPLEAWVIGSLAATAFLVAGYVYFRRTEPFFADWLGE
jgi:lipopolysaccharide transport system permease protein